MLTVGAFQAKTNLAQLLDRVLEGETVVITRRGVPVATINPIAEKQLRDKVETIQAIRTFRKGNRLNGLPLRELVEEGRRF
ncbi:MAG TPA: type II toxin-antitoxin system prevent-host-death family antitoxin [Spirochaetia bacterium]|nr:type II toxin-antitoxin system prevent-host-death family antitoxin [Spirochaetia bacterium]